MQPNIVLIILDSISYRDSWLDNKAFMPNLYSLKDDFINCHSHYSVAANTKSNVVSLLTGVYPANHQVTSRAHSFNKNKYPTLQSILSKSGYYTWYKSTVPLDHSDKGTRLGFDELCWLTSSCADYYIPGEKYNQFVFQEMIELQKKKNPFFMLLHYSDAHQPFEVPKKFVSRESFKLLTKYRINPIEWLRSLRMALHFLMSKNQKVFSEYPFVKDNFYRPFFREERCRGFYEELIQNPSLMEDYLILKKEVHLYSDYVMTSFINKMKESLGENTLFILLSDHGNQIESKIQEASTYLYDDMVKVPLSFFSFDNNISRSLPLNIGSGFSSQIDIFPTILSWIGLQDSSITSMFESVNKNRALFCEYFSSLLSYNEVKVVSKNFGFDFKLNASNFMKPLIDRNEIVSRISEEQFAFYIENRQEANDLFENRTKVLKKIMGKQT